MSLEALLDGLVDVDDIGGDVSIMEEASLLRAAEFVGERDEDGVEQGGDDSVIRIDHGYGAEICGGVCRTKMLGDAGRFFRK